MAKVFLHASQYQWNRRESYNSLETLWTQMKYHYTTIDWPIVSNMARWSIDGSFNRFLLCLCARKIM